MNLCQCGCGQEISKRATAYRKGHHNIFRRLPKEYHWAKIGKTQETCLCGCGQFCKKLYISGHNSKGRILRTKEQKWAKIGKVQETCLCGCGQSCKQLYVSGHNQRGKHHKIESIQKMKAVHKGKIISKQQRQKISKALSGRKQPKEYIEKRRLKMIGKKSPLLGRKLSRKHKKNISKGNIGHIVSKKTRKKLSIANKNNTNFLGKKHSIKTKQKLRESTLKRIIRQGSQIAFNERTLVFFGKINKQFNMNALFGKNEFKCLGYSLDFYSPKYNFVIEWNERQHYRNNKLSDKHKIRQNRIKKHLKCKFINIRQKTFNENKIINFLSKSLTLEKKKVIDI